MPLLDHFRPPLDARAPWASIGSFWLVGLARQLNTRLPRERYVALATTHLGSRVEADVSEFELPGDQPDTSPNGHGGVATLTATLTVPLTVPTAVALFVPTFTEVVSVQIHDTRTGGMRLVGAIEFVSPSNKDRDSERRQFVAKCVGYLRQNVGLVVVDVVTNRSANLHNELMATVDAPVNALLPDTPIYVAGYRNSGPDDRPVLASWHYPLVVGDQLPAVPLALKDGPTVLLDLDGPYSQAVADHNL